MIFHNIVIGMNGQVMHLQIHNDGENKIINFVIFFNLNSKVLKNDDLFISKQNIENNIDEWTPLNLGVKFKFRKYQKRMC